MASQSEELVKELFPDLNDRRAMYDDIANAIIQGIQVSPEEMAVLAWGLFRDNKVQPTLGFNEIDAQLENAEKIQPGSTQRPEFNNFVSDVDTTFSENAFTKGLALFSAAKSIKALGALRGGASSSLGIIDRIKALGGKRLLRGATIFGGGALAATSIFSDNFSGPGDLPPSGGQPPDGTPVESPQDDLNPIVLFDPNTQTTTALDPRTLDPLQGDGAVQGAGGGFAQDLTDFGAGLGIDLSGLGGGLGQEALNSLILGDIRIPTGDQGGFPFGAGERGQPLKSPEPQRLVGPGGFGSPHTGPLGRGLLKVFPEAIKDVQPGVQGPSAESPTGLLKDLPFAPPTREETVFPPGGQVNPRAFQAFSGRTLIQMVAEAASRYQVPVEILYGIINQESGFNTNAVGDQGRSFGLGQIFLPAHPSVTRDQALNPAFAINWTAANLVRHFKQFGSWEAALMAHRSPDGAAHFVRTGEFKTNRDRSYLNNVLNFATNSGIGNQVFDFDALGDTGVTALRAPDPPFVEPDRAELRNFIRSEFQFLEREPTPEELARDEEKLIGFFREAHKENVRAFRGATEVKDVNPQERFREELRGSGEGLFREETRDTRTMFDFMGQLATVLRQA